MGASRRNWENTLTRGASLDNRWEATVGTQRVLVNVLPSADWLEYLNFTFYMGPHGVRHGFLAFHSTMAPRDTVGLLYYLN